MREADAQIAEKDDEDQIFVATCFSTKSSLECWLIESGCTNHMTYDRTLFKDLQSTEITKVRIGNGDYISAKGKRNHFNYNKLKYKIYFRCSLRT